MEKKPENSWKTVDPSRHHVIPIHIIISNFSDNDKIIIIFFFFFFDY
jgi:hypothetical protein